MQVNEFELLWPIITYLPKQPAEEDTFLKLVNFLKSVFFRTHRCCVNYLILILNTKSPAGLPALPAFPPFGITTL